MKKLIKTFIVIFIVAIVSPSCGNSDFEESEILMITQSKKLEVITGTTAMIEFVASTINGNLKSVSITERYNNKDTELISWNNIEDNGFSYEYTYTAPEVDAEATSYIIIKAENESGATAVLKLMVVVTMPDADPDSKPTALIIQREFSDLGHYTDSIIGEEKVLFTKENYKYYTDGKVKFFLSESDDKPYKMINNVEWSLSGDATLLFTDPSPDGYLNITNIVIPESGDTDKLGTFKVKNATTGEKYSFDFISVAEIL